MHKNPFLFHKSLIILLLMSATALSGCTLFTRGEAPTPDVPAAWLQQNPDSQMENQIPVRWWQSFDDPTLDHLIARALAQSPDQRLIAARIKEARALAQGTETLLFPTVNANASVDRIGSPNNGNTFRRGINNVYDVGFDASWELDLFGRNRQQALAADANTEAVIAEGHAATLSLISEITRQYTLFRLYQTQAALAADTAKSQNGVMEVTRARYEQGVEGNLELTRAQALLSTTQGQIPLYESLAQTTAYQIDYLVGDKPGTHSAGLNNEKNNTIPVIDRDVFLNVPVNVIQRRPDIIAAEQRVLQATSLKKSAIAEIFPTISLSGLFGFSALRAGDLFTSNSQNWSVGGSVIAPLLDFGRIRAGIGVVKAREEQALIQYEQTVLNALRDVETAAGAYKQAKIRYATLKAANDSSQKAVDIARLQYKEGILSQLDVLTTEQNAYSAEEAMASAAADLTQNFIALCKALALMPEETRS